MRGDRVLSICAIIISVLSLATAIRTCSLYTSIGEPEILLLLDGQFLTDAELQETDLPGSEDVPRDYAKNSHGVDGRHFVVVATVENTDAKFPINNIELEFELKIRRGAEEERTVPSGVKRHVDYVGPGAKGSTFVAHFDVGDHEVGDVQTTRFSASWKGGVVDRACGFPKASIYPGEHGWTVRGGCVEESWF